MLGTSTPFHSPSHAPFSLFYGSEEASTGAVGFAIVQDSASVRKQPRLDYGGLQPLSEPYEVTRCASSRSFPFLTLTALAHSSQGNIVLSLSSQNAARLLLGAVNALFGTSASNLSAAQRNQEKEKEFFVAVYEGKPEVRSPVKTRGWEADKGLNSSRSIWVRRDTSRRSWPATLRAARCRSRRKNTSRRATTSSCAALSLPLAARETDDSARSSSTIPPNPPFSPPFPLAIRSPSSPSLTPTSLRTSPPPKLQHREK